MNPLTEIEYMSIHQNTPNLGFSVRTLFIKGLTREVVESGNKQTKP